MKPEKKRSTYSSTPAGVSDSGTLGDLTSVVVQGTGSNQRVGSKIHLLSLYINYGWVQSDKPIQTVRTMIIWGNQPLTISDMPTSGTCGIQSMFDTTKGKVLYDQFHSFNEQVAGNELQLMTFRKKLSLGGRLAQYALNQTTGNAIKGNLYLFFISDSSAVFHPTIEYGLSISYYDA